MMSPGLLWKLLTGTTATVAVALGLSPVDVPAQSSGDCDAWENEYVLVGNLQLSDTPMGQGDGVYSIGPGRAVLRFENKDGAPGGRVKMLSYSMAEHFTVSSRTLFWKTTVVTDNQTHATPDACGVVASGALSGDTLAWSSSVRGYTTDGTLTCEGSLCGKFGAPPPGRSELHIPSHPVQFEPFTFGANVKTFTMPYAFIVTTEMPKQTAHLSLAAREIARKCVVTKSCG